MSVVIRLSRQGRKGLPHYTIQVADQRFAKRFIETIGYVNTSSKEQKIATDRYEHWIGKGAQPTDTVRALYNKATQSTSEKTTKTSTTSASTKKASTPKPATKASKKKESATTQSAGKKAQDSQPKDS